MAFSAITLEKKNTKYDQQELKYLSHIVRKRTFWHVHPSAQSDQSFRCPHEETLSFAVQNTPSEDSDQPARACPNVCFLTLLITVFEYSEGYGLGIL